MLYAVPNDCLLVDLHNAHTFLPAWTNHDLALSKRKNFFDEHLSPTPCSHCCIRSTNLSQMYLSVLIYGFGTCSVLLTIKHAISRNKAVQACTSTGVPSSNKPYGSFSCIQPPLVRIVSIVSVVKQAKGIGVPSKYFDLPVASLGSIATVTLNRASLVNPHRT